MSYILINGKKMPSDALCIRANDRGLTLGHGLFETMVFNKGSIPLIQYHWNRLTEGATILGIPLPFNLPEIKTMIEGLLSDNQLNNVKSVIRLTLTDGVSERGLLASGPQSPTCIITTSPFPEGLKLSMTATLVEVKRNEHSPAARVKHISYLDNILAKKEAVAKGFDEAILLNSKNYIAEGSLSNLFMIKNNRVYTPRIEDGALPGVIRHVIVNALTLDGLTIGEHTIDLAMILDADEIFITNAVMGITSIRQFNNTHFVAPFPVTDIIRQAVIKKFNYS